MDVVTDAEREDLWATHDTAKRHRVDWWPATNVADGGEGYTQAWPARSTTYACAVLDRPASTIGDDFIQFPVNTPSRIVMLSRSAAQPAAGDRLFWVEESQWLEVLTSQKPGTNGPARRIECIEIIP